MTVSQDATLLDVIRAVEEGEQGIAFVAEPTGRVIGTITDGDIRRALLRGADISSRCATDVMTRDFTWVDAAVGRAEVLDLMRARDISQLPVLGPEGQLIGLHLLRELVGAVERPNWAVIMAGGKGTRLRPLTENLPKPMLPVAGRPILERIVLHLVGSGIRRIFISVNHMADVIERHFHDGSGFGCEIQYLREEHPLGTGGSLILLRSRTPSIPVLVMNGDLLTQFDVDGLLRFHHEGQFAATFGVRPYRVDVPFGVAHIRDDRLVALKEKPSEQMLINAGIYVLSPEAFRLLPKEACFFPITDLFERCLGENRPVGAYLIQDEWTDVGRPEEFRRARGEE